MAMAKKQAPDSAPGAGTGQKPHRPGVCGEPEARTSVGLSRGRHGGCSSPGRPHAPRPRAELPAPEGEAAPLREALADPKPRPAQPTTRPARWTPPREPAPVGALGVGDGSGSARVPSSTPASLTAPRRAESGGDPRGWCSRGVRHLGVNAARRARAPRLAAAAAAGHSPRGRSCGLGSPTGTPS